MRPQAAVRASSRRYRRSRTAPRHGALWSGLLVAVLTACAPAPVVLLPERPPAPLDRPIGIDEDVAARPRTGVPAPPVGVVIGGAEPLHVVATAPDGQWVALCSGETSETGDGSPALVVGTEPAFSVERFVAFDSGGRHLALVQDGALVLLDAERGVRAHLRDVDDAERSGRSPLPVGFDATGERIAYLVETEEGFRLRVRFLADRAEREIDPGPGRPLAVHLEADGGLQIEVQVSDGPPEPMWSSRDEGLATPCRIPTWRPVGASEIRYAHVDGAGVAKRIPNVVAPWPGGIVARDEHGALVLRRHRDEMVVVDADCGGELLHRDVRRRRLLVACRATEPASVRVYALGRGDESPDSEPYDGLGTLSAEASKFDGRAWVDGDRVLFAEAARMLEISGVQDVLHASSSHALVRRASDHALVDFATAEVRVLEAITGTSSRVLRAGSMVALVMERTTWIIDLDRGRVHGRTHQVPLGITRSGHLLVAADVGASSHGALMWIDPSR